MLKTDITKNNKNLEKSKNSKNSSKTENKANSDKSKDNKNGKDITYKKNVNLTKSGDRIVNDNNLVGKDVNFSRNTYSFWIYFILIITSLILVLRLFVFYKKKDYMQISKKYDDVEGNSFIAEI